MSGESTMKNPSAPEVNANRCNAPQSARLDQRTIQRLARATRPTIATIGTMGKAMREGRAHKEQKKAHVAPKAINLNLQGPGTAEGSGTVGIFGERRTPNQTNPMARSSAPKYIRGGCA